MIDKLILEKTTLEVAYENIAAAPEENFATIRMQGLGASESSIILNVNPFPNGTIQDLINQKVTGEYDKTIGEKPSVKKGKDVEPIILNYAEKILKTPVHKPINMYRLQSAPCLTTNFDGVTEDLVPVEAKLVTKYGKKYYDFGKADSIRSIPESSKTHTASRCLELADRYGIPVYYFTQLQQQILFLNQLFGYLVVMDDELWEVHIFKVYADPLVQQALILKAKEVWDQIETKKNFKVEDHDF